MPHSYNVLFVILSVLVAMLASYTALDLAGRVRSEGGTARVGWVIGGATVMGLGIWSMHFVGMLAFHLPVQIGYDVPLMLLSVAVAIAASLLALSVITRESLGLRTLVPAGFLMGGAIAGMHYIGMASVRAAAHLSYSLPIVALSIGIAIVASMVALWLAFTLRTNTGVRGLVLKALSAGVMGIAISGMHYTAMAAARFSPVPGPGPTGQNLLASGGLGAAVVISTVLIIILALIGAVIDRDRQSREGITRQLVEQTENLGRSERQYRLLFDSNPNPMWVEDAASGRFVAVNEAAVAGYGYSRSEFLAMTRDDIAFAAGDADAKPLHETDAQSSGGGSLSAKHRTRSGKIIDVTLTSQNIVFDRAEACLTLALDVTDRMKAEEALRQSEQRTRLIVDTALDAVITMNSDDRISEWNAQAEKLFGWTREEAVGKLMTDTIIPVRFRTAHQQGLATFLRSGHGPVLNKRIEITALCRDGREIPIELAISPARLGTEWTFSAFIRDLTDQKRAQELLRAEEQRYRELFEDVPVGLYRSTPEGELVDANPAMVEITGYPDRKALLATSALELYAEQEDRSRWAAEMTRSGFVRDFDVRMKRHDGALIWVRETTHAKRDDKGRIVLYEGVLKDITDRVEAEQRLRANEQRLNQILEAAPLGIFVTDSAGHPVFANAGARDILGKGAVGNVGPEGLAVAYSVYLAGTDEVYPTERLPIVRALTGETTAVDDLEIRRGGKTISLTVQSAPLLDDEGKIIGAVGAFLDTTDRRMLEAQLRQALKMEAVGQLAGGIAHDFNNLLTVIMSYGSMLLDRMEPDDSNREDVQEIASAATRAAGLTRQLLAFSRKQVIQPNVIDINRVVGELQSMLGRLIGEDVELETVLDPSVGTVSADPGQLEQLLINLVVNARDAMPEGGRISIRTSAARLSSDSAPRSLNAAEGDYVVLEVIDTGIGMTKEVQQRMFDPFFTTKEKGRGTGLGLSTVYGIVKQSGAEILVQSEPGRGSAFRIYFPQVASASGKKPVAGPRQEMPTGTERVLLVEDDDNLRTLAVRVLKKCGYEVLVASCGSDALEIAADPALRLDAVVTDVVMPGMNGRELVEKLLQSRPGLGYLLMSGYTDDDVLRRGVQHGETPFLQKPFTPAQLATKLRSVLDGTRISERAE